MRRVAYSIFTFKIFHILLLKCSCSFAFFLPHSTLLSSFLIVSVLSLIYCLIASLLSFISAPYGGVAQDRSYPHRLSSICKG